MQKVYSVCWNITGKCNENCKFCYRTIINDLRIEQNMIIEDKLIEYGVEKITFAGGEPLLYDHLFSIARYIKERNPDIILSLTTNGLLVNDINSEEIISLFDWITFDLESYNKNYNIEIGRGENHLEKVFENLRRFNQKINIKINTVAMKNNINEIPMIFDIIKQYNIRRWKILRYYSINFKARANEDKLVVGDCEFQKLLNDISSLCDGYDITLYFNDYEEFETSYFSIFFDGSLKDNTGNVTCNILDDSIDMCIDSIDLSNHYIRRRYRDN